jgi:iron complex outermembrane receptor protein
LLTVEAVHSENTNIARVAPDPVTGMTMPITSPFYPSTFAGLDTSKGLIGIGWRMVPAGRRENTSNATANRIVADLSGVEGAWEYKTGFYSASSTVSDGPTNGYVSKAKIQAGVTSGLLNPFGANTQAALDYIDAAKARSPRVVVQQQVLTLASTAIGSRWMVAMQLFHWVQKLAVKATPQPQTMHWSPAFHQQAVVHTV